MEKIPEEEKQESQIIQDEILKEMESEDNKDSENKKENDQANPDQTPTTDDSETEEKPKEDIPKENQPEETKEVEKKEEGSPNNDVGEKEINRHVPLSKYLETKKESKDKDKTIGELQKEVNELKTKTNINSEVDPEKIKEISEKYELKEDFVRELTSIISPKLPIDVIETLNSLKLEKEIKEKKEKIEIEYQAEFLNLQKTNSDIDFENIDKDKLHMLAFSKDLAKTPLNVIFKAYKSEVSKSVGKRTMETGKPTGDENKDISKFTDDDIGKMTDSEFDEYSKSKEQGRLLKK